MNRCLILFGITTVLMLLSDWVDRRFNKYEYIKDIKHHFIWHLGGAIFVISAMTFGITLVFAVYIFIFQYTPSLYFS